MRRSREWAVLALVALLVFLYRFNTLGGELGGFDNDHFIGLARADQLLAGEWPLRDYPDGSLQGAWPPLAYLPSAAALALSGRTLLGEGVLTTAAVAAAAVLTVCAGRALGLRWLLAVAAVVVSVLPSVKLYGYARPLLFASTALLLCRYADRPSTTRLLSLSVLAAAAFLLRHDYAVYVAVGIVITVLARHRRTPAVGVGRVAVCGGVSLLLLVPTLVGVERMVGLRRYVEGARTVMADEAARTNLKWPEVDAKDLWSEQNTLALPYYVFLALPPLAAIAALWRARAGADEAETAKVLGLAAMGALANHFLLRGNLEARLADSAVLDALLGMWLVALAWSGGTIAARRSAPRLAGAAVATGVAVVTTVALGRVGAADRELRTAGFNEGPIVTLRTTLRTASRLRELPPTRWEAIPDRGPMLAAAYLSECTQPTDRVINATYYTDFLFFGRRRFAAGRVNFVPGFYTSDADQRLAVDLAQRQAAPVAFTDPPPDDDWIAEDFPIFNAFLRERYRDAGTIRTDGEPYLHVLVRRDLPPRGTFAETGLPCFR